MSDNKDLFPTGPNLPLRDNKNENFLGPNNRIFGEQDPYKKKDKEDPYPVFPKSDPFGPPPQNKGDPDNDEDIKPFFA